MSNQVPNPSRDWNGHVPPVEAIDYNTRSQEVRGYGLHPQEANPIEYPPVPAPRAGKAERPVKQSRDRAQYVRQQKGHSWILHWLVLGIFTCFIVPIYYSVSPNHYWHI